MKAFFLFFFVHLLCTLFATYFKSKKVLKADPDYIKKIQINWENFAIVRDKKIRVEIKVFLMTYLIFS